MNSIIVTGRPRSGTSMMMQMLEAGGIPCLYSADKLPDVCNPKGYYESKELCLKPGYAQKILWPELAKVKITPEYKVIHITRDVREVVLSQTALSVLHGLDKAPEDYYERLRKAQPHKAVLAKEEQANTELTEWLDSLDGVQILTIDYKTIVNMQHLKILASDCDLDVEAIRSVIDPSLYRVRIT